MVDQNGLISGTLVYVDDYTGFSSDTEYQSGYYLALHLDSGNPEAFVSADLVGKTDQRDVVLYDSEEINDEQGGSVLDSDGELIEGDRPQDIIAIFRISPDKGSQTIEVVVSKGNERDVMTLSLDGLILEDGT